MINLSRQLILLVRYHTALHRFAIRRSPSFLPSGIKFVQSRQCLAYSSSAAQESYTDQVKLQKDSSVTRPFDIDELLEENYIMIRCCKGIWYDFPQGTMFDAGYIDSHSGRTCNPTIPVILLLHDAFGSHTDFIPIIKPMVKLGYRVIAPSFPGTGYTKGACLFDDNMFTNGTDEQVSFVEALLEVLNIERVDMVIGHGSGCHPASVLGAYSECQIKSTCLICPTPHKPSRQYNLSAAQKNAVFLWDNSRFRLFLRPYLFIMKYVWGMSGVSIKRLVSILQTINGIHFHQFMGHLMAIKTNRKPICMIYSGQDEKVESELSEELAEIIGYKKSSFYVIDEEGQVKTKGDTVGYPKGLFIESGSHEPFKDYSTAIVKLIWNFVKILRRSS